MKLYLLRHGTAEDAARGQSDADRRLTAEGREEIARVARTLAHAGVRPTQIISSTLVRAVETAEIAAQELGYQSELLRSAALTPESDPRDAWQEIRTHSNEPALLLASHNPLCAELMGFLLGTPRISVHFGKGAVLCVDLDRFGPEPRGVLRFLLPARLAGSAD